MPSAYIDSDRVRAVVGALRDWGYDIPEMIEEDLVEEFNLKIEFDLGGGGQHRRDELITSKWAAQADQEDSRVKVLIAFARAGRDGLTNDEMYSIVDPYKIKIRDSWVPRVGELKRMKPEPLVEKASNGQGQVKTRRGESGKQITVHVATAPGIAIVKQEGWM